MGKLESNFQRKLKKKLRERYGPYVFKNDPSDIQGIPDLTILYKDKWAMLEVKKDKATAMSAMKGGSGGQANQAFRVNELNEMSYAAFIYPENVEEVFHELDKQFGISRDAHEVLSKQAGIS